MQRWYWKTSCLILSQVICIVGHFNVGSVPNVVHRPLFEKPRFRMYNSFGLVGQMKSTKRTCLRERLKKRFGLWFCNLWSSRSVPILFICRSLHTHTYCSSESTTHHVAETSASFSWLLVTQHGHIVMICCPHLFSIHMVASHTHLFSTCFPCVSVQLS